MTSSLESRVAELERRAQSTVVDADGIDPNTKYWKPRRTTGERWKPVESTTVDASTCVPGVVPAS